MFDRTKKISRKKRPSISDYNKYLIQSLENKDNDINTNKINNSFVISSYNPLSTIKPFNNPNKKLLLEKLDTSNFHKNNKVKAEQKSFQKYNTINFDNSEDLFMAQKLSSSIMSERSLYNSYIYHPKKLNNKYKNNNIEIENNLINNNTKERTSSTFDNDIMDYLEASPLEIYNRRMEYISHVIKIQSLWRKYIACKKVKIFKFFRLIEKILHRQYIYYIKLFFINISNNKIVSGKIYYKKVSDKNLIKKSIKFHIIKSSNKNLKTEQKYNIIENKDKDVSKINKQIKSNNWWLKLPLIIEKYIKNKVSYLYSRLFFENLKLKEKEALKNKQNKILYKLINSNDMKNLKTYMNRYKEKALIEKQIQKPKIYYSLIKAKSRTNPKNKIFNFQTFYKENTLENIIKKYRYTSIIQKYYLIWKKKSEENKVSNNKKKRVIKIKKVKKNIESRNDLNILKEDTLNNVSEISHNMSYSSNNTLNSIQSIHNAKICLTNTNKKMRIKRINVDKNYYKYIRNNNHYNNK